MSIHKDVTFTEVLTRGGWSSGTNMDTYRVCTTAATLPGAKALSGWADARGQVHTPQLAALGEHARDDVEKFMLQLFSRNHIPLFQKGGALWPLLQTCTATMIMYYRDVVGDLNLSHPLVQKINAAAEATFGGALGRTTLNIWSKTLKENFNQQNLVGTASHQGMQDMLQTLLVEN